MIRRSRPGSAARPKLQPRALCAFAALLAACGARVEPPPDVPTAAHVARVDPPPDAPTPAHVARVDPPPDAPTPAHGARVDPPPDAPSAAHVARVDPPSDAPSAAHVALVDPPPDAPTPAHVAREQPACDLQPVEHALSTQPSAAVIVLLRDAPAPAAPTASDPRQDALVRALGSDFQLSRRYASVPGVAGVINQAGFARARTHADVRCIQLDGPGSGATTVPKPVAE